MFSLSSASPLALAATSAPEPPPADPRVEELAARLVLANATLVGLERYADRTSISVRLTLPPRLARLRTIEGRCLEWLHHPQAGDSPTLRKAVVLLENEADALEALSDQLSPQDFTAHLQQRKALEDRAREAQALLPREERTCEAARAYFDALLRLDTTDVASRLPTAIADTQAAVDGLCAFVAAQREAQRRQAAARKTLPPTRQCPEVTRLLLERKRHLKDIAPATSASTAMLPPQAAPKRRRMDGLRLERVPSATPPRTHSAPSTPEVIDLLADWF